MSSVSNLPIIFSSDYLLEEKKLLTEKENGTDDSGIANLIENFATLAKTNPDKDAVKHFFDIFALACKQWSRIVAWTWLVGETEKKTLRTDFIKVLQDQALNNRQNYDLSKAYDASNKISEYLKGELSGKPGSESTIDNIIEEIKQNPAKMENYLTDKQIKEVLEPNQLNQLNQLTDAQITKIKGILEESELTIQQILGIPDDDYPFTKTGFMEILHPVINLDSFSGGLSSYDYALRKFIVVLAYPPRPEFSPATVQKEKVVNWAQDNNNGNWLPPSAYIPTCGC